MSKREPLSDNDRLAEIEARANITRPGPYYPVNIFHLTAADIDWLKQRPVTNADVRWLIARVRELEAQAARDAALRDVVMGEVHYWEVRVEYWEGKIERSRGVDKDIAIGGLAFACERRDTLRAALAAREEE